MYNSDFWAYWMTIRRFQSGRWSICANRHIGHQVILGGALVFGGY